MNKNSMTSLLLRLVLLTASFFPALAAQSQVTKTELNTGWQFRQQNHGDWLSATVPGMIQADLHAHKKIPDPYYGGNWYNIQWVDKVNWEYRTTFDAPQAAADANARLVFNGLDTYATVWLNDQKILDADNMHRTWKVDVKPLIKPTGNTLRVLLHSPTERGLNALKKYGFKLVGSNDWPEIGGIKDKLMFYTRKPGCEYGWNICLRMLTSGIWRPVVLESWNDARIEDFYTYTKNLDHTAAADVATNATIGVALTLNAAKPGDYTIALALNGAPAKQFTRTLQAGENHINETFDVPSPRLWWPNGAGELYLYDVAATLSQNNAPLDTRSHKLGIRTTELVRIPDPDGKGCSFGFKINGRPIFAKGANMIPSDVIMPRVTPEKREFLIRSAADVHMNMIRVWGGGVYEEDHLYELCDKYGIMIWHDFMFACGVYPGDAPDFHASVKAEAADNLRRLRNHPSIVLWCGNNEIEVMWNPYGSTFDPPRLQRNYSKKSDIDRITKAQEALFYEMLPAETRAAYADNMPYWASSPSPGPKLGVADPFRWGDYHYWKVWHGMKPVNDYNINVGRFMSEYGIQSFPELASLKHYIPEEDLSLHSPTIEAHQLDHRTGANQGNDRMLTYAAVQYRVPKTFANQVYITQLMQADAMRTAMEAHRRGMPWCQGSLIWQLNDDWPCVTKATIDYYGYWKATHYWMRKSCDDVLISPYQHDGTLDIQIVNDRYTPLSGTLMLTLQDFAGKQLKTIEVPVTLPANSSTKAATYAAADLLAGYSANNAVLVCELKNINDGQAQDPHVRGPQARIYRALHYFNKVKDLSLPKPTITFDVRLTADGNPVVKVTTDVLAKSVMVMLDGEAGIFTDNFFDLLPGEPREIALMPDTPARASAPAKARTAAEIKSALAALSVADTY